MKQFLAVLLFIAFVVGIIFTVRTVQATLPQCYEVEGTEYTGPCEQVRFVENGVITGD